MLFQPLKQTVPKDIFLPVQVDDRKGLVVEQGVERAIAQIEDVEQIEHSQDHGNLAAGVVGVNSLVEVQHGVTSFQR